MHDIDRHISQWISSSGLPLEDLVRLLLAALVGGMVGLEREIRGREAGFRTNLLVCLGSALVMIVSNALARGDWVQGRFQITVDPGRIAYGVMAGVGFLGAGTIIQHRGGVRGLTTAAGLWCVAAVGLAAGFGLYLLCVMAGTIILIALWMLSYLEAVLPSVRYRTAIVRVPWQPGCLKQVVAFLESAGLRVADSDFKRTADLRFADVSLHIAFRSERQYASLEGLLQQRSDYELLEITHEP